MNTKWWASINGCKLQYKHTVVITWYFFHLMTKCFPFSYTCTLESGYQCDYCNSTTIMILTELKYHMTYLTYLTYCLGDACARDDRFITKDLYSCLFRANLVASTSVFSLFLSCPTLSSHLRRGQPLDLTPSPRSWRSTCPKYHRPLICSLCWRSVITPSRSLMSMLRMCCIVYSRMQSWGGMPFQRLSVAAYFHLLMSMSPNCTVRLSILEPHTPWTWSMVIFAWTPRSF